ncbi:hypothetical protein ABPG72_022294 [Tetrahymena utriculariae]
MQQQSSVIKPWGNSSVAVKNLASYKTIYEIQSEEYKAFLKNLIDIQNKQTTQKQKDQSVQNKPSQGNNQQDQNKKKTYQNRNNSYNNNQNNNKSYQHNNNNKNQNNNNNNNNNGKQQKGKYQQKENQNSNSNSFLFKNENSESIPVTNQQNQQQANFNNIQDFTFKKGSQINNSKPVNNFNNVKQTIQSLSLQKLNTNSNSSNSFSNININNQNQFENQNKKIVIPHIPDDDDDDDDDDDEQDDKLFAQQILQNIPKSNSSNDVKKTNKTFNISQQLSILYKMEEEDEEDDNDDDILQIANNLRQEFFKSSEPNYGQGNQKKDKPYKIIDESVSGEDIKLQQILKKWN